MSEANAPKFLADAMLGKLATWMRILGYDVEYAGDAPDADVAERAVREDRLLLTRDTLLVQRRRVRQRHFFIYGDDYRVQLRQVVERFPPDPGRWLARCLRCNRELAPVPKESVRERVPPYVYGTQERFEVCPRCGRAYWRATHPDRMRKHLLAMLDRPLPGTG